MAIKLITDYQGVWNATPDEGYFWFTYHDGARERTITVDAASFSVIIDMLRNEDPVYGDHTRALVMTQAEEVGEEEA